MKCEDFEFKCSSLSDLAIETQICFHYDINSVNATGGFPSNFTVGKPENIRIHGDNKNLTAHVVIYPDNDGGYVCKMSNVDVTQNRQRRR